MHAGALAGQLHGIETIAPSPIAPRGEMLEEYGGSGSWPTPREMRDVDIESVVEGFADAAVRAQAAGFDGVELHAANGYLLDQFLTAYTNTRDDEFGGTVVNRIRLTARIVAEIGERTKVTSCAACDCPRPRSTTSPTAGRGRRRRRGHLLRARQGGRGLSAHRQRGARFHRYRPAIRRSDHHRVGA
jgi:hypothetical protein